VRKKFNDETSTATEAPANTSGSSAPKSSTSGKGMSDIDGDDEKESDGDDVTEDDKASAGGDISSEKCEDQEQPQPQPQHQPHPQPNKARGNCTGTAVGGDSSDKGCEGAPGASAGTGTNSTEAGTAKTSDNSSDGNNPAGDRQRSSEDIEAEAEAEASGVKLALLPDFRSKTLWLCAIIDTEGVQSIVTHELRDRLTEIVESSLSSAGISATSSKEVVSGDDSRSRSMHILEQNVVNWFCKEVEVGVKAAAAAVDLKEV
jgi:hypothetical protein